MSDIVQYEVHGRVGVITLNRPEKLNAWTPTMADEQAQAIQAANDDPTIGAIVMTRDVAGYDQPSPRAK